MTGKTHQVIGQTVGLATFLSLSNPAYNPATLGASLVIGSLAALLPDIDQSSSVIWRKFPLGRLAGKVVDPFIEHRNFSHSIVGVAVFGLVWWYLLNLIPPYWGIDTRIIFWVFIASYSSHLLADMVTVEGIPLLFPYQKMFGFPPKPFEGVRIMTGRWFENWIIFPLSNLLLLAVIIFNWGYVRQVLFK